MQRQLMTNSMKKQRHKEKRRMEVQVKHKVSLTVTSKFAGEVKQEAPNEITELYEWKRDEVKPQEQLVQLDCLSDVRVTCTDFGVMSHEAMKDAEDQNYFPFPSSFVAQAILECSVTPALTREQKHERLLHFHESDFRVPTNTKKLATFFDHNIPMVDFKVGMILTVFLGFLSALG